MSQPTAQDLHVDGLLTMISTAYMNDPNNYIADKVFPIVRVRKQSDKIAKYDKDFWLRDEADIRGPGTESAGGGYTVDTSTTYFCDNYAFHADVNDEDRRNADQPFDPDVDATVYTTDKLLMKREKSWASDFFKTGVWGTSNTPSNLWSDYALSTPIEDHETGRTTVFQNTAREVNTVVYGRQTWAQLKHHPDFIERIKYTQRGVLTPDIVAAILEIDRILIGKAIEATSKEGQTTTTAYIYGKHALMLFVPSRPSLRTPAAGYTFYWPVFGGGLTYMRRVRNDFKLYDRIEGHTFFDQKALGTDCGYAFISVVS